MSANDDNTKPLLGRCKECDYALFATLDEVKPAATFNEVKAGQGVFDLEGWGYFARCTNRHKAFKLKQIKGTYSKDHKCDSRCLNAKGNDCTCSCGGMNHGRGHAVTLVEASTISPTIATDATEKQTKFISTLLAEREIPSDPVKGTSAERREQAEKLIESGKLTKRQASATIEWLLSLPKEQ